MTNSDNPCPKDCQNRTTTCKFDGTCDKYRVWREKMDDQRNTKYRKKDREKEIDNYKLEIHRKKKAKRLRTK